MTTASETPTAPAPAPVDAAPAAVTEPAETATPDPETETEPDPDADWPHQRLDFHGLNLAIRHPSATNISGVWYALDGETPIRQLGIIKKFIRRYMSMHSAELFEDKIQDPDIAETLGENPIRDLFDAILAAPGKAAETTENESGE